MTTRDAASVTCSEMLALIRDWIAKNRLLGLDSAADGLGKIHDWIESHRSRVAGLEGENATLRLRLSECCVCSFEGSPRKQVTECHLHACQRSGTWENGDPLDWINHEEGMDEATTPPVGGPTDGNTLRAEIAKLNGELSTLRFAPPSLSAIVAVLKDAKELERLGKKLFRYDGSNVWDAAEILDATKKEITEIHARIDSAIASLQTGWGA